MTALESTRHPFESWKKMDMRTSIYPYGAPELNLLVACLTELSHYYKLPMWGTAGCTDAKVIGAQAGSELMFECLTSLLAGADFVHDTGLMDHATMVSPELIVLMDETIAAARVLMGGIEISNDIFRFAGRSFIQDYDRR
ncbi:MAG: trimethylamine methyltransferase family protein [Candidatus Aminicenantes bacterium]|nr:trimethylamine methyltransferase family protein [Candidatus Aminicenantes bacterium]